MATAPLALLVLSMLAAGGGRPKVDAQALGEAIRAARVDEPRFASSASYAHFLRARMLHDRGEHRAAVDELLLARATDPDSPALAVALAEEWARMEEPARAEAELKPLLARRPDLHAAQLLLGRVLLEQQRHARAGVHLRRARALRPEDPSAWLALVQLNVELGQYDEAALAAEGLAAARPGDVGALRRLGAWLGAQGDAARAEPLLRRAVELAPSDAHAWWELARLLGATGRLDAAREAWARAAALGPEDADILMLGARLSLEARDGASALAQFSRALARESAPEPWARAAGELLSAHQPASAASLLDEALELGITEPRIAWYAGLVHERLHHPGLAADRYAAVAEDSALYAPALGRRAGCLSRAGRHAEALALLQRAEGRLPEPEVHQAVARALERAGDVAGARARLERALKASSAPNLFAALGGLLARAGQGRAALEVLERGARAHPGSVPLGLQLADALARTGQVARARAQLEALAAAAPSDGRTWAALGHHLAERGGEVVLAEAHLRRALQLQPGEARTLAWLASAVRVAGDLDRARGLLAQAAAADPDEPAVHEHMGDLLSGEGRSPEAAEAWGRALRLLEDAADDGDAFAAQALRRKLK